MQLNILITGGAGYIGSILVPKLLYKNHKVTVIDNLMFGIDGLLVNFANKNFKFINEDVYNSEFIKKNISNFDFVIHLAAIVGYPACKKYPELAVKINKVSTEQICNLLVKKSIPILYSSTGSNYGAVEGEICTEETPLNPVSIYGETKTAAELIASQTSNFLNYRFATAFGVSPRMRLDLLINDFVYQAIKNKNLTIYEKNFKRTFIHVIDIAENIIFGIEKFTDIKNNTFNIGSNEMNYSKAEIANIIKKKIPYYLHYAEIGTDEDKRNYEVDYSKSKKAGFKTKVDIETGLNELIEVCKCLKIYSKYSNI
tara:strand:- start:3244 stop:4182 length:939 start_codon:yes stop_codon:yes gene_type:complete